MKRLLLEMRMRLALLTGNQKHYNSLDDQYSEMEWKEVLRAMLAREDWETKRPKDLP